MPSTVVRSRLRIAAMPPGCCSPACFINRPRSRTSLSASGNESAPAHTSAENSPRLCPATSASLGAGSDFDHAQRGDAVGHDGRLCVDRVVQLGFRPFEAQPGKRKAQDLVGLGKDLLSFGKGRQLPAHARRIESLGRGRQRRVVAWLTWTTPDLRRSSEPSQGLSLFFLALGFIFDLDDLDAVVRAASGADVMRHVRVPCTAGTPRAAGA